MAEAKQFVFTHREVVEALLKKQGIHEGIWGLYIRFGIKAANVGGSPSELMPSAIIPVLEIGLQKFDKESNIAVDAALVNPKVESVPRAPRRFRTI
ncbi:MAG: hypothetical protein FJW37_03840 [Acidobacteria bacterium]|nr:hypothetical protein [Acidobacteriota bacterium]